MPLKVAVLGAGVNGLSCAIQIAEHYKQNAVVTILSEKFTPNTTGDGSAGLWGPYLLGTTKPEKILKWSKDMHDFLEKLWLSGNSSSGVCLIPVVRATTSTTTKLDSFWSKVVYGYRKLSAQELQVLCNDYGRKFTEACSFVTYTSEPCKLLPFMTERFLRNGGKIIEKKIENLDYFVENSEYDVIINCTGLGSKNLLKDDKLHSVRGQVSRVKADWLFSVFLDESDDGNYIIPNCDSIVLGGTHQEHDYNTQPTAKDKQDITTGCYKIIPALKKSPIIEDWAGLRPGRSEIRLEKQIYGNGKIVIHNYGHGGSGVTLCWGCAIDVLDLLKPSIKL